jgi:hypothetical protein
MSRKFQILLSLAFGVAFMIVMLVMSFARPDPTSFQYLVFRVALALAGAGVAAIFLGFIEVTFGKWLRAGGALAVFAVVYFLNPAQLVEKPTLSKASGDAKTSGSKSPAVSGNGNNIKYDDSSNHEKKAEPPKKE